MALSLKPTECKLPLEANLQAKSTIQLVHTEKGVRHESRVYLIGVGTQNDPALEGEA